VITRMMMMMMIIIIIIITATQNRITCTKLTKCELFYFFLDLS